MLLLAIMGMYNTTSGACCSAVVLKPVRCVVLCCVVLCCVVLCCVVLCCVVLRYVALCLLDSVVAD
jgi:hypothetical protein